MADARTELREGIDLLEETYEFLLSYAARGLPGDEGEAGELRDYLERAAHAVESLAERYRAAVEEEELEPPERHEAYAAVVEEDARKTLAVLRLVQGQPSISSQLVDNLNASIHLRALLTELFVVKELLAATASEADQ
jgi:siroheme synthase